MVGTRRTRRRSFGTVRRLPSGMYQARVYDPVTGAQTSAPTTFQTKGDASAWLAAQQTDMIRGTWQPQAKPARASTFAEYADQWLARRDLKPRTLAEYRRMLDRYILPTFAATPLPTITPDAVRAWHAELSASTGKTQTAHAYSLLRTILGTAVADELLTTNPCRIRGAGQTKRSKTIRPATLDELEVIVEGMPPRLRLLVLLAAWTALRFGEATELRRKDVDVAAGVLRIRRGVTRVKGEVVVGLPKSSAGARDVAIPPHLLPLLEAHLAEHVSAGADALLFPGANGGHLAPASLYGYWYPARHLAGRDDLRFHDLRHTGAVLAASTGATLAELMARLGHSTPAMALRYQHAAADRDRIIAEKLSELARG